MHVRKQESRNLPLRSVGVSSYHFEKADNSYHDTYFGMRDFIGEEIIYRSQRPAWGMNYFGVILVPDVTEEDVYGFLRDALMRECVGIVTARGPTCFEHSGWQYINSVKVP